MNKTGLEMFFNKISLLGGKKTGILIVVDGE